MNPIRLPSFSRLPALLTITVASLLGAGDPAGASTQAVPVAVFPEAGSRYVPPHAQIAFRGVAPTALGAISVTGSSTGKHAGRTAADSDGDGVSFLPDRPFRAGETVTVRTSLNVLGGSSGSFHFTVARPAPRVPSYSALPPTPRLPGDVARFVSRSDLHPAAVRMLRTDGGPGDIFLAPQQGPVQFGPMIVDSRGQLVWFKPLVKPMTATDFRVQRYRGQPVLTWWQGLLGPGIGTGRDQILDSSYRPLATVAAADGLDADLHEFQLTAADTALITAYYPVYVGRGAHQRVVLDSVAQEIDVPTGLLLFSWDSLNHVPLADSEVAVPPARVPYDYFHINSVGEDQDGTLIISARNTWAAYKVGHRSGRVIWILGGRRSTFRMGPGASFAFQHDVRPHGNDATVTLFDDGAGPPVIRRRSRVLTLALDLARRTATRLAERVHAPGLLANFEGNAQALGDSTFVGWGQQPFFTQYDADGRVVLEGRLVNQNADYRIYRFPWSGTPVTLPAAAVVGGANPRVLASWNGATNVVSWRVMGGASADKLVPIAQTGRTGFETSIPLRAPSPYVAVMALDDAGNTIGTSKVIRAS